MKPTTDLAPIALFVFNRPSHTQRLLASLSTNAEFLNSYLYIFCDGSRRPEEDHLVAATRGVVHDFLHPNKIIIESTDNKGLAKSIRNGVSSIFEKFDRIIVLEDDLITSSVFLNYMNTALELYSNENSVMQISGHMFNVAVVKEDASLVLPFTTSWGWGTWRRAWKHDAALRAKAEACLENKAWRFRFDQQGSYPFSRMLLNSMLGGNQSWAIWWYFQVFCSGGLTVFPGQTLVLNSGFDGTGTNCRDQAISKEILSDTPVIRYCAPCLEEPLVDAVRDFLRSQRGLKSRVWDWLFWRARDFSGRSGRRG